MEGTVPDDEHTAIGDGTFDRDTANRMPTRSIKVEDRDRRTWHGRHVVRQLPPVGPPPRSNRRLSSARLLQTPMVNCEVLRCLSGH